MNARKLLVFVAATVIAGFAQAVPFERELGLPKGIRSHRISKMVTLDPGAVYPLFEVEGPGCITHIWMTLGEESARRVVLRMYWDDETEPSVEAPLADFFGVGHNETVPKEYFATPCLTVAPRNGYNMYLPMPFKHRARITVTNELDKPLAKGGGVYFQADYEKYASLSDETPYFHGQWRREAPAARRGRPYTVVQALGKGFIAGLTCHVSRKDTSDEWFHGGGDYIYLDGESAPNLIQGIGGEDFFGQSWGSRPFVAPHAGCMGQGDGRVSFYRFFLEAPPRFERSVRFAFGAMANEMTSVGYWYQTEPHTETRRSKQPQPQ